ncbi:MAG TPA: DEAD/DEAH box helicase [Anaerolineae bacterium]|nr:DEAD/DEAH box helicase [Anaerolineae bacterium]
MDFKEFGLDRRLLRGIEAAGFVEPTPIQTEAMPLVLAGGDVMGLAQTGTGKTAAFMLPILQRLATGDLRQVRALVVAPTRELAEQIHQATADLGRHMRVKSVAIYGGVGKGKQISALRKGAEIVVACPGRLLDLLGEGKIDLSGVEVVVLDEADRMCDMGFLPDIRRIMRRLPTKRQTLFFSATMPDDIRELADEFLHKPKTVQIGMIAPAKTVTHAFYPVADRQMKRELLAAMLPELKAGRMLIFTRTKYQARNLAQKLSRQKYRVTALQGNMSQNQRQRAIDGYRDGKYDILVATDIAARGIDVADISHVINFDMPDTVDAYTHRIGRTGRAEQEGEALTLAEPGDAAMVRSIERLLGETVARRRWEGLDYGNFEPEDQFKGGSRGSNNRNGKGRSNGGGRRGGGRGGRRRR